MIWIGTSGYSYPEWKGSFYPAVIPQKQMFAYYAARLSTVEINHTFRAMPEAHVISGWATAAPPSFRYTLKAPQTITHHKRLVGVEEPLQELVEGARLLGPKLGTLLFQLPPNLKKDTGKLGAFLALLPEGIRAAFEFRHDSWHDDAVFELLRGKNAALCIADSEALSTPVVATADFGYFRLRDEGYKRADIARWSQAIHANAAQWKETFVYFKHESAGKGPAFAAMLKKLHPAAPRAPAVRKRGGA
jgi:uncharacterized protein YecE (DUF72 family)